MGRNKETKSPTPKGVSTKSYKSSTKNTYAEKRITKHAPAAETANGRTARFTRKNIIIAAIVLLFLIAGIAVGVVAIVKASADFNFLTANLSKYVEIDRAAYAGYKIEIDIPKISEQDVQNEILSALAQNKGELRNNGEYSRDFALAAGDKVYIYCRGYEYDDNGNQVDVSGACNYFDASATELEIGSGSFAQGFELSLVGKVPSDYPTFTKVWEGEILPTDIVYVTASYTTETGMYTEGANLRIDLSDPKAEAKWGVGIYDYLKGIGIGEIKKNGVTELKLAGTDDSIVYFDTSVKFVTHDEEQTLTVAATFPYDYEKEESLRNKTVYYDVYIQKALYYESATLTDDFVLNTLKINQEGLDRYEGSSATEKYIAGLWAMLESEREENITLESEELLWEHLLESAVFKKLPQKEVDKVYNEFYYIYNYQYVNGYQDYYSSVGEFISGNVELEDGQTWQEYLTAEAEAEVKEKLIFFSILRQEQMLPSEEEYQVLYRQELESGYEYYYKQTREDFDSDEEYERALENYKRNATEFYGEDYFEESVYYNHTIDKVLALADIVNKADNE